MTQIQNCRSASSAFICGLFLSLAFAEFSKYLFRDGLQGVKHALPGGGDGLDNRLALTLQFGGEILDRNDIAEVALVELKHVRNLRQIVALRLEVLLQVVQRLDVGIHSLFLRIGHENNPVNTFQNQLARCVVKHLTGNRVQVEARLKSADRAQLERHEIEEQRAVRLSGEADELAPCLGRGRVEDVLQVGRLTTQAWAVVNDLAVDFSGSVIDKGHSVPLAEKTVDVLVGNAGEWRIEVVIVSSSNFVEHCRQLMRNLLTAKFH